MPELPEVQTVVNGLIPRLEGKNLKSIRKLNGSDSLFSGQVEDELNRRIIGQRIHRISRRAKFIVWLLDRGVLTIHLRMTGRLMFSKPKEDNPNHYTAVFEFMDGTELWFKDYRKFGRIQYFADSMNWDVHLGIEPLSTEFTQNWLYTNLKSRHRQFKPLLLDQTFIAGLGNIYADEVLWEAKIHPKQLSDKISRRKTVSLHKAIQSILEASIQAQGTTIINFAFNEGETGNFMEQLKVVDREGLPCHRCGTIIHKTKVSQRGTYFCPKCQRKR